MRSLSENEYVMLESYLESHRNKDGSISSKYKFLALLLYFRLRDALGCGYRGRHFHRKVKTSNHQVKPPKFADFPLDIDHVGGATGWGCRHGFVVSASSGSGRRWIVTEKGKRLAMCLGDALGV